MVHNLAEHVTGCRARELARAAPTVQWLQMAAERASSGRERGRKGATRAAPSRKQYDAVVDEDDLEYGGGGEESSTSCRRCCLAGAATSALLLAGVVAAYGYRAQLLGLYHGAAARLAAPAAGAPPARV